MKKPRRRRKFNPVDLMDETSNHCQNIVALAELMGGCDAENLNPAVINHTGNLIFDEGQKLQEKLAVLYRQLPKPK